MKQLLLWCTLCCIGTQLMAQDRFTYISDRKFTDITDLVGFNFVPSAVESAGIGEKELTPGEYSFGITRNNLYVSGIEIKGVYSLNNMNTTDYGFKLLLMNARDPRIQGHLKVILNNENQVEALIFKRSNNDPEMIFFNGELPKKAAKIESSYFTDLGEMKIESKDSLWGTTLHPFLKIHDDVGTQERLTPKDSVSIFFEEIVTVIEKEKKKKKKKKEKMGNIELGEEEEEKMKQEEMPELVVDDGAMPPITQEDVDAAAAAKNIKIEKTYFVKVRSILTFEDGSKEDKVWEFPVKKMVEREDEMAGPLEERFQIEITPMKGDPVYLYLTGNRMVSSFEMGPKRFLMRGH